MQNVKFGVTSTLIIYDKLRQHKAIYAHNMTYMQSYNTYISCDIYLHLYMIATKKYSMPGYVVYMTKYCSVKLLGGLRNR